MQGNKTLNIEVTTIGGAEIAARTEGERRVFFSTLLERIAQLAKGGECG